MAGTSGMGLPLSEPRWPQQGLAHRRGSGGGGSSWGHLRGSMRGAATLNCLGALVPLVRPLLHGRCEPEIHKTELTTSSVSASLAAPWGWRGGGGPGGSRRGSSPGPLMGAGGRWGRSGRGGGWQGKVALIPAPLFGAVHRSRQQAPAAGGSQSGGLGLDRSRLLRV